MFTIIGGDGVEYGPVSADQVRAWITAGRANLETKAKTLDAEEWRRLGDYAEFAVSPSEVPAPAVPYGARPVEYLDPVATDRPVTAVNSELAGLGERFLAALLDTVIYAALCIPGVILIQLAVMRAGLSLLKLLVDNDGAKLAAIPGIGPGLLLLSAGMALYMLVQAWLLVTRGQTIGKLTFEIRVVTVEEEAQPRFAKICLLRAVVPGVLNAVPLLGMFFHLTDIFFIFRADRRCIHDLIAGTKVIKA
jgi:uncharacterized RDD family membrane protein YckC